MSIADRGFFDIKRLRRETELGIFWVTRIPASTTVMIGEQELPDFLKALSEDVFDASATLGKNEQLPVRLVGFRVDEKTAARHRQNLCKAAKKHGIEVNGEISSVSVSSLRCIQRDTFKKLVQQEQLQMVGKFGRQKMEN